MSGIIYKFENIINGKVYIGQTIHPKKRFNQHKNCQGDSYFHRAIKKYGFENFKYEILETVEREKLNEREIYWVDYYDSFKTGYNQSLGGSQCTCFSDEMRQKNSQAHIGLLVGERNGMYGKKRTDTEKKTISDATKEGMKNMSKESFDKWQEGLKKAHLATKKRWEAYRKMKNKTL